VRFLVDAQLPARLANLLNERGHDAVHTTDLPDGNRSTDTQIAKFADDQDRVVVTKDRDFRDGHLITGSPRRVLIVATGNITNTDLLRLFTSHLEAMTNALSGADLVEIGTDSMVVHPRREPGQ